MWWLILIAVTGLLLAAWAVGRVRALRQRSPEDLERLRANQAAGAEARERRRRDRHWGEDDPGNHHPRVNGL